MKREKRDACGEVWWRSSLSQIQERTWDTAGRRVVGPFKRMKRLTSGEAEAGLSQGDASDDEDRHCRDRGSGDDRMMGLLHCDAGPYR